MYQQETFVNTLIEASTKERQQKIFRMIERKKKTAEEKIVKMHFLTEVYFEEVNKLLMEKAITGSMYTEVTFYVHHFKVSEELEKLGVFIGYPNEIATRWLNEMADPDSTFLKDPFKNWKGLTFKILDRFEGVDLKSGNGGMCKGEPTFNIEFSWIRNTKTWSKYRGVQKVDKDLTLEEDKEEFTHFIPTLDNSGKDYNCSFENISERFSSEIEAARGFDDALKNIGLEPVNFGILDDELGAELADDDDDEGSFPY